MAGNPLVGQQGHTLSRATETLGSVGDGVEVSHSVTPGSSQSTEYTHPIQTLDPMAITATSKVSEQMPIMACELPIEVVCMILEYLFASFTDRAAEKLNDHVQTWVVQVLPERPSFCAYDEDIWADGDHQRHRVSFSQICHEPRHMTGTPGTVNPALKSLCGMEDESDDIWQTPTLDSPGGRNIKLELDIVFDPKTPEGCFIAVCHVCKVFQRAAWLSLAHLKPYIQIHGPGLPDWSGHLAPLQHTVETIAIYPSPHPSINYQPLVDQCRKLRHIMLGKTVYHVHNAYVPRIPLLDKAFAGLILEKNAAFTHLIKLCRDHFPHIVSPDLSHQVVMLLPITFKVSPQRAWNFVFAKTVQRAVTDWTGNIPFPIVIDNSNRAPYLCLNDLPIYWKSYYATLDRPESQGETTNEDSEGSEETSIPGSETSTSDDETDSSEPNVHTPNALLTEWAVRSIITFGFNFDKTDSQAQLDWDDFKDTRDEWSDPSEDGVTAVPIKCRQVVQHLGHYPDETDGLTPGSIMLTMSNLEDEDPVKMYTVAFDYDSLEDRYF